MVEFIEFLGWVTAVSFGFALLNYILKFVNKKWIMKLPPEKKKTKDVYKKIMRPVVKYHKIFGFIAGASLITHFIVAYTQGMVLITGIISGILMVCMVLLGMYGAYINKKYNTLWLKIHRTVAFLLILSIIVHLIFKL